MLSYCLLYVKNKDRAQNSEVYSADTIPGWLLWGRG